MTVTKFKLKKDEVFVAYSRPIGDKHENHEFTCDEKPLPALMDALKDLAQDVVDICELSPDTLKSITVTGVSFSWTDDIMGATIIARRKLKSHTIPLQLNTPHTPERPYAKNSKTAPFLTKECTLRLRSLLDEVEKYINGDRAQGSFDFEKD
jgi:hypothetical protein